MLATVVTEVVYERVRRVDFGTKPSRLGSAFACGSPEAAMFFALKHRAGLTTWFYEIGAEGAWVADMAGLNPSIELGSYPIEEALRQLHERARLYWSGLTQDLTASYQLPEILLPSESTVLRELTPPFMA
jgi:hypothetical protein